MLSTGWKPVSSSRIGATTFQVYTSEDTARVSVCRADGQYVTDTLLLRVTYILETLS